MEVVPHRKSGKKHGSQLIHLKNLILLLILLNLFYLMKNIYKLRCVGTPPSFTAMFSIGDNFLDFMYLTLKTKSSQNGVYS